VATVSDNTGALVDANWLKSYELANKRFSWQSSWIFGNILNSRICHLPRAHPLSWKQATIQGIQHTNFVAHSVYLKMHSDAQNSSCIIKQCLWKGDLAATATKYWRLLPCEMWHHAVTVESYQHLGETWCLHLQVQRVSHMGKYGYRYMEIRRGDSPFMFTIATNIRSHTKILRRQDLLSVLNPQPLQSVTASETSSKSSKQANCMMRLKK
jgi:hypothetical protein